jgi:RND superfamily putative drug exporter
MLTLAAFGMGVGDRLHPSSLRTAGTESERAKELISAQFGSSVAVPVLLEGPSAAVDAQGRRLVARLARQPGITLASPWNAGAYAQKLRPRAGTALILASVNGSNDLVNGADERIERVARSTISGPVHARITGTTIVARELTHESMSAVHRAELIAIPILLLVLLLVFRSPVAAAVPVLFGGITVAAGHGVLSLLAGRIELDSFATAVGAMMGLALAVDYSLLIVSRYREEMRGGEVAHADAVAAAGLGAGRTVVLAGSAIAVAMAVGAVVAPGASVLSAGVGVASMAALSVAGAIIAVPAALMLIGPRLDRGAIPRRQGSSSEGRAAALGAAAMRRPASVAAATTLGLLLLALPALGLRTGAPGAGQLPKGSVAGRDFEAIGRAMGPGWETRFELVAVADNGTMTTAPRLAALARFQRRISKDPDVAAVMGPGALASRAARLRTAGRDVAAGERRLAGQSRSLKRLDRGVNNAASDVGTLRSALGAASSAATRIDGSTAGLAGGMSRLRDGVRGAATAANTLAKRLAGAGAGARGVATATAAAATGAAGVSRGIATVGRSATRLQENVRGLSRRISDQGSAVAAAGEAARAHDAAVDAALMQAERALRSARMSVQTIAALAAIQKARSALAAGQVAQTLASVSAELDSVAKASTGVANAVDTTSITRLGAVADQLVAGIGSLSHRLTSVGLNAKDLTSGGSALVSALQQLGGGADRLDAGVGRLRAGIGSLAGGMRAGQQRTSALAQGLDEARGAVAGIGGTPAKRTTSSKATTGSFLDSGYFVLAALEGTAGGAGVYGINLDRGGRAARILIVPRGSVDSPSTRALYTRLQSEARSLGLEADAATAIGGPAATLIDYDRAAVSHLPAIALLLSLVTVLLLALVLRSIVVPLIGVALNLLTVAATFGAMTLLFGGEHPLLGGPGRLDSIVVTAVFGVMFALSTDYQVFIVARVREEFARSGDATAAVAAGVRRTAHVVTGAALSMLAVFVAFAFADVASLRQFGAGLAIAVLLDATVVRLALLPALLKLVGRWAWWVPEASGAQLEANAAPVNV